MYFTFANLHDDENFETLVEEGLGKTYSFRMRYFTKDELRIYFENIGFKEITINDEGHQLIVIAKRS